MAPKTRHLIVGGGICGLLHAWFALKKGEEVIVLEKEDRAGGLIQTSHTEYGMVESAANAIINSSVFEDMARELGVELIFANKSAKKRYIYYNNKFRRLPLDWSAKLRLIAGVFLKDAQVRTNESLASWAGRVLGKGAVHTMVQPAFGGIYAGDINKMHAPLVLTNRILTKGSMIRQLRYARKLKKKYRPKISGMVSPKNGMGEFVAKLKEYIQNNADWQQSNVRSSLTQLQNDFKADKLTLCTGLAGALPILLKEFPEMDIVAKNLEMYDLVSITRFQNDALLKKPGFGVLFGPDAPVRVRGILFNDFIFQERVGQAIHSETWIYGGAFDKDFIHCDEKTMINQVETDRFFLTKHSHKALYYKIHSQKKALPAYNIHLWNFNKELDRKLPPNWRVEGNFRYGIGLGAMLERAAQS